MAVGPKLWTINALATEFQKDRRTVAKRLEEVEEAAPGKYLLRHAAPAILGITALDPTQQRAALENARTRKIELEIEKLEGSLLDATAVRMAVENMIGRARAKLLAVPAAQAGRANPEDPKRAEAAIRDGIYEALTELADAALERGAALEAAAEADDSGVGGRVPEAEPGVERVSGAMED
jgi:hypothetical protein